MKNKYATNKYIARTKIKKGDVLVVLWKKYVRPAKVFDRNIYGISTETKKSGQKVNVYKNPSNLIWEAKPIKKQKIIKVE